MLAEEPAGKSPAAIGGGLQRLARLRARAGARYAAWVAEAERTDAAKTEGFGSTTEWLAVLTGEPVPVCRSQVAVAEALGEMPETQKAFAAGEVSESRVKVLAQAQALCPEQFAQDEKRLVAQVAAASPQQVPKVLAAWKQEADPKAAETEVERLHRMRALHLSRDWSGMLRLHGLLDPESGLIVGHALEALSDPANLDPADTRTPARPGPTPSSRSASGSCKAARRGGDTPPRCWSPSPGTPSPRAKASWTPTPAPSAGTPPGG